jgi:hypothetical protein
VDHQIGAFGDDVEFVVGNQGGDLDNHVFRRFEASHF